MDFLAIIHQQYLRNLKSSFNRDLLHQIDWTNRMIGITGARGVGKTTLWRWAKQKYLTPVEIGGKRRYKMSEVKRLLEGKQ